MSSEVGRETSEEVAAEEVRETWAIDVVTWDLSEEGHIRADFGEMAEEEIFEVLRYNTFLLFAQETYWRDIEKRFWKISEMEFSYVSNVLNFLERGAAHWGSLAGLNLFEYLRYSKDLDGEIYEELMGMAAMLVFDPNALKATVLYNALATEREARINDPEVLGMLATPEERQLYETLVRGSWPSEPVAAAAVAAADPQKRTGVS